MREAIIMQKVTGKFLTRLLEPVDWIDLQYAYENELIDEEAIINHACRILAETECDNDAIFAIASASKNDALKPLIELVAGCFDSTPERKRKWAMILAAFISESNITDKLAAIEEVYSSFDYPEELAKFVRYMPMNGPDLGNREANEDRILQSLRELSTQIVCTE